MRTILAISLCLFAACATDESTEPDDISESEAPEGDPFKDLEDLEDLPALEPSKNLCVEHPVLCAIGRYEHAIKQQP